MYNNVFTFGDTTWKQNDGTAHHQRLLQQDPPLVMLYWLNGLGIWLPNPGPAEDQHLWKLFQQDMNDKLGGLKWEFTPRASKINFMDLTIHIHDNHIQTTLFQESPQSAPIHPPALSTPAWSPVWPGHGDGLLVPHALHWRQWYSHLHPSSLSAPPSMWL
jgi:hypothetical protein